MLIAYRGNFQPSHSTETHVSKSMELLGHKVLRIQENHVGWERTAKIASAADVFWYTRTWDEDWPAGLHALQEMKSQGVVTVSHHLDLYIGLGREYQVSRENPFWATDYVFTADGGHQAEFEARGINHHWIRPGVYGPECYMGRFRRELSSEIAFVGAWRKDGYHKEWPYRQELIEWLRSTYGSRVRFFAEDRPDGKPGNAIRGRKLNDLYASAKVVVGDSCNPGFKLERYWSDRAYETLGRGGYLIHPLVEGMQDEFTHGMHLMFYDFGDFTTLKEYIEYDLCDESQRERIRKQGHEHVKANCTYRHRVMEILGILREQGAIGSKDAITAT